MRVFKKSELAGVRGWIRNGSNYKEAIGIPDLGFHVLWTGGNEDCNETNESFMLEGYTSLKGQQLIDRLTSLGYQVIDDTKQGQKEQFWMVWSPLGKAPTVKHLSEYNASCEANRLAMNHPQQEFYILKAISCTVAGALKRDVLVPTMDDQPF